ncbi:short chain dehydrogenase [Leucobacter sp. OLJS4]|uniref:short chain dehydrogenase n=1 Tax=unclassified Leucobacter TaxID=2621730 RepID=UPI000C17D1A8|nr:MULTISPECIES: short chain dehydrogenase [unclassified Leucobacter]PII85820.1 short chain dehydrogenase [Leucobacter sp. OLCALW19]PII92893.1 short chain dehydrogenase [Leucobacter sp. OLAS13]PII96491.1 short chain dehydrogenase [Leucobacter sp. OLTLW20]PII96721.1 short chain dehydrogenase [Leucobacter sp. OLDS2]PII98169.1 short chain dehydrogenase [Leucobacter sp. OLCS4]
MRILIVGASGHVGSAAAAALREKHEVVGVSRSTEPGVDLSDAASIERLFAELGEFDAVVSAYGSAPFKPAPDLTPEDLTAAFEGKVLSQLNLVRIGLAHVRDGGSFTLTTGILAREAVPTGAAAAMANGAVESFVISAAGELPRGIRLNAVSPTVLASAPGYFDAFPGFEPVSDERVGQAFVRSVEGISNGRIYALD